MAKKSIQAWLNGEKLHSQQFRKWYPLLGMIAAMMLLYIFAGYGAAKQQHRLTDTKREMLDAKYQYMTISAELVKTTRQSYVVEELRARGSNLRECTTAPIRIQ